MKIGIDGLNISESSSSSLWPILGSIPNAKRSEIFVIGELIIVLVIFIVIATVNLIIAGVFHGSSKPANPNEFLQDIVNELTDLTVNGIMINCRHHQMEIFCFLCDSPAHSFVTCTKGHYFACPFFEGKVVYLDRSNNRRTDEDFRSKINEEHHVGRSVLEDMPRLDMILCFPVEPMHLLYLGVSRRMIMYWLNGPKKKLRLRKVQYELLSYTLHRG